MFCEAQFLTDTADFFQPAREDTLTGRMPAFLPQEGAYIDGTPWLDSGNPRGRGAFANDAYVILIDIHPHLHSEYPTNNVPM